MSLHRNRVALSRQLQRATIGGVVMLLGAALAGCSKEGDRKERNYAAPNSLCGVAVNSDLLSPFLPPGDRVSMHRTFPDGGTERCTVIVDKSKVALFADQEWLPEREGLRFAAPSSVRRSPDQVTENDQYLYAGAGATGRTKNCADPAHPEQRLFTTIQSFTRDREDSRSMGKLIKTYTKMVEQSKACHPKPSKSSKP